MKILLAIDGSEYTQRLLDYARAHPELLGYEHHYTLFTVVPAIPHHAAHFLDRSVIDSYYKEEAEKVLGPAAQHAFVGFVNQVLQFRHDVDNQYKAGHAADEIAQFATEDGFDLIVMGTHGHGMLKRVVLGSVTTGVLAKCKIPVLLIH